MPACITRPAYGALMATELLYVFVNIVTLISSNLLRVFVKVVTSLFVNLVELVASASAGPAYRALMATALLPPLSHYWWWPLKGQ